MNRRISRRTALKGLGTLVALPWLKSVGTAASGGAVAPPTRMAVVYVPNGVNTAEWTPKEEGADYALSHILEPLAPVKQDVLVLSGLAMHKADGPSGNHARASAVFLTGLRPPDNGGVHLGVSADQLAARAAGRYTPPAVVGDRLRTGATPVGHCDDPYSCAYTSTISWKGEASPLPHTVNPREVFDRLFAGQDAKETHQNRAARIGSRKSILDFVREDATALRTTLGGDDQRKIDEYLTSIREVETRIERTQAPAALPPLVRPDAAPADYPEHLRILCDLLVLAFQADVTRVATFLFANEFSNRPYPCINVPEGHHDLSHHENKPEKLTKISVINRFHVGQFAYLLGKLAAVREGDGTLLDHCVIAYGCGNSDGNRHNHDNLPILLAGGAGAGVKPGRHIRCPEGTPLMNLWLSMLDRVGRRPTRWATARGG